MGFMDKVKTGLSEAGSKAKMAVEVNKLKIQSSSKQKEIEHEYKEIGRLFFLSAANRTPEGTAPDYQRHIDNIIQLEAEIHAIKEQLKLLANEKECVCGKTVPLDARFCSSCGHTFPPDGSEAGD